MRRAIIYLTELDWEQLNKEKKKDLICWCKAQGMQMVGVVSEESASYALTTHSKRIIYNMVKLFKSDMLVIYSARELGRDEKEICENLCDFMAMDLQVVSLRNDLPENPIYRGLQIAKKDTHCKITLMDWE